MKSMNIRLSLLIVVLVHGAVASLQAQDKYIDTNGIVIFEASEQLFEEVKAANESVTAILSTETNQIASLALIKGFHFKNSLMEEHFNENYIESDLYPKAKFKGSFIDLNVLELDENVIEVPVEGVLEVRGERKAVHTVLKTQKIGDIISITGEFTVTPGDFGIEIPKIVRNKIAKEVLVKLDFKLAKK